MPASRAPINLGSPALRFGAMPALPLAMQSAPRRHLGLTPEQPPQRRPDASAMAAALGGTPTVESGNVIEALAAALEGGIRGRAAWDERRTELDERDRETREREGREHARTAALEAYRTTSADDPNAQERAIITALGGRDDETALSMALSGINRRQQEQAPPTAAQRMEFKGDMLSREQGQQQFAQNQETIRRGQDLDLAAARERASGAAGGLSPRDETRLGSLSDAAATARSIQQEMSRFATLNARESTGEGSSLYPNNLIPGMAGATRSEMRAITDRLVPMLNAVTRLPGAASERDAARLTSAAPNVGRLGTANDAIIAGYRQTTQNVIDYSIFAEQYAAAHGSLIGVDTQWNNYLEANPIFDENGNVRRDRPTMNAWMQNPQPYRPSRGAGPPPPIAPPGRTRADVQAEIARRRALPRSRTEPQAE